MKNHTAQTSCKFFHRVCLPTVTLCRRPVVRRQIPKPFPLRSPVLSTGARRTGARRTRTSLQLHCRAPRSTERAVTLAAEDHWQRMTGSPQQAGWCKKPASPTDARATLKVVRKTTYTIVLLTITAVAGATGTSEYQLFVKGREGKTMYQSDVYSVLLWY